MKKVYWPIIISIALCLGILLGAFIVSANYRAKNSLFNSQNKLKLNRLIDFIEKEYVDNVNTDSIVEIAVGKILEQLDPHSVYLGKQEFEQTTESMQGSFVGIGINYYYYNDSIAIIKNVPFGPASKSGLLPGDRILRAEGEKLFGPKISADSINKFLKGPVGSDVNLQVYRRSFDSIMEFTLKRSQVVIPSVDIGSVLSDSIGFIKINRFSKTTHQEFVDALTKLSPKNIKALVIDLRDNGGGYMNQAVKILDDLLLDNQVIVKTVSKKGETKVTLAKSSGLFTQKPVYILINEQSASASEIIAGAIQDNDRGVIVGRRSFGKGLVQRELLLGDGSAIRLTTARYYTPSGRSIQKPYKNGLQEYNRDFLNRYKHGELFASDSIQIADSLQFKTLNGRTVYAGGGIVPDIFVGLSSSLTAEPTVLLMQSGIVNYYVFETIDKDRAKYQAMSKDELVAYLTKDSIVYNGFINHLSSKGLFFKLDKHKQVVMHYLIAEFIHQILDQNQYYQWLNNSDPMLVKVREDLK
ncbi:S41 family peptidase [Myroides sp. LJL119]